MYNTQVPHSGRRTQWRNISTMCERSHATRRWTELSWRHLHFTTISLRTQQDKVEPERPQRCSQQLQTIPRRRNGSYSTWSHLRTTTVTTMTMPLVLGMTLDDIMIDIYICLNKIPGTFSNKVCNKIRNKSINRMQIRFK